MSSFQVGTIRVRVIQDGMLRLDPQRVLAGQPEEVWRDEVERDAGGMAQISVSCLVVESGGKVAVLDTGLGLSESSPSTPSVAGLRGRLMPELQALGIRPEQVDAVVVSHAHGDHLGGNVIDGRPAFPRARYHLGAADVLHYTGDGPAASPFHAEQILPLAEREQLEPNDGEVEVLPGVRILPTPGHTPGHVCVGLTSGAEHAIYLADLVHLPAQISHPEWSPIFDWMPDMSAKARQAMVERARRERTLLLSAHFPFPGVGRVGERWVPGA